MQKYSEARNEIVKIGRISWDLGLNSLKSGNLSVIMPNRDILITRTGKSLRELQPGKDLTIVPSVESDRGNASCEFYVHRAIYQITGTGSGAILHCHPPCSIAASSAFEENIPPAYNEAKDVLGTTAILNSADRESFGENPANVGHALRMNAIVAVRGHGTFALAENLAQGLYLTELLERSCRILLLSGAHQAAHPVEAAEGATKYRAARLKLQRRPLNAISGKLRRKDLQY